MGNFQTQQSANKFYVCQEEGMPDGRRITFCQRTPMTMQDALKWRDAQQLEEPRRSPFKMPFVYTMHQVQGPLGLWTQMPARYRWETNLN
jgi:hypothetical protein